MANNKFQMKRTTISGRTPNTTNSSNTSFIDAGEFAVNLTDQKVYSSNGSVAFEIGANLASLNVGGNVTIGGNLQVTGASISISGNNLSITDSMLYLNQGVFATITNVSGNGSVVTFTANNNYSSGWDVYVTAVDPSSYNGTYTNILTANATHFTVANTNTDAYVSGGNARGKSDINPDIGFAAGYNDGTYHHTGFFRDATDGRYKVFDSYLPEPDESSFIDTANASFKIADFQANTLYANSIYANGSLGTAGQGLVSNGTAVYWSNNPGFTGSTGAQGPQGATGPQGPIGFTGSAGTNGTIGYNGSQGATGFTGSKGTTTIANTAPESPVNGDTWWNSETGVRYVYYADGTSNQWVQESATGPIGFTGSAGTNGTTGFTGSRGFTGSQGTTGFTGSAGSGGSIGGSSTQVLFNDSDSANGSANFTYNKGTRALGFTGNSVSFSVSPSGTFSSDGISFSTVNSAISLTATQPVYVTAQSLQCNGTPLQFYNTSSLHGQIFANSDGMRFSVSTERSYDFYTGSSEVVKIAGAAAGNTRVFIGGTDSSFFERLQVNGAIRMVSGNGIWFADTSQQTTAFSNSIAYTWSSNQTFIATTIANTVTANTLTANTLQISGTTGISINGNTGTAGQVLTSNGSSSAYWATAAGGGGGGSGMVLISNGNISMLPGYPKYLDFGATLYGKYILFLEGMVVSGMGSEYLQPNTTIGSSYTSWIGTATTTIAENNSNTANVYATSINNSPYPPAPSPPQGVPIMGTPWNPNISASMGYFNGSGYIVFEAMNSSTAPFGSFYPTAVGEFTYSANYSTPFSGYGMASDKIALQASSSFSSNVTGLILNNISNGWYSLYGVPQ